MLGEIASQVSTNNPNTRWANPAPVMESGEVRKLHSKTMIVDGDTASDPTVIVGSTNWSNNGNNVNDENMLIIHDTAITNQFVQEFYARYKQAGGVIQ
jgi:phosphatidylserine/phosphatidylglycerophosphate/cardiolipin synthase-like enzyme